MTVCMSPGAPEHFFKGDLFHVGTDRLFEQRIERLAGVLVTQAVKNSGFGADDEGRLGASLHESAHAARGEHRVGRVAYGFGTFRVDEHGGSGCSARASRMCVSVKRACVGQKPGQRIKGRFSFSAVKEAEMPVRHENDLLVGRETQATARRWKT